MTQLSGQWKRKHRGMTPESQVRTFSVSFNEITEKYSYINKTSKI